MNPTTPRRLRVGVMGLGFGAEVHVPALLSLPDVELVALGGLDAAKARAVLERLGLPPELAVSNVPELLERGPRLVSLALPPHAVETAAMQVLDAGCAVLCEKPLGDSAAAAWRLVKAARARNLPLAVDFQFAELPVFQRLAASIAAGDIGTVRHVTVTWLMHAYAHKVGRWSWKTDGERGGGVMNLFGTHLLYLAEWLFGPVEEVWAAFDHAATAGFVPAGCAAAEELVHLRLKHASGCVFQATFGNAAPGISRHLWHVIGSSGSLVLDNPTQDYMRGFRLSGTGTAAATAFMDDSGTGSDGRIPPFRSLAQRLVKHILAGQGHAGFRPGGEEGARVQGMVDAARLSAVSAQRVIPKLPALAVPAS